ncbi:MAG: hypothetical protein E7572_12855 [Ruminococcaceae bacterium]|nr:hypothetical protein [Oscillospiraceae bacterium]
MTNKQQWQLKGLCLLALKRGAIATTPDGLMRIAKHVIRTSPVRQLTKNNALWLADKVAETTRDHDVAPDSVESNRIELRRQLGKGWYNA